MHLCIRKRSEHYIQNIVLGVLQLSPKCAETCFLQVRNETQQCSATCKARDCLFVGRAEKSSRIGRETTQVWRKLRFQTNQEQSNTQTYIYIYRNMERERERERARERERERERCAKGVSISN